MSSYNFFCNVFLLKLKLTLFYLFFFKLNYSDFFKVVLQNTMNYILFNINHSTLCQLFFIVNERLSLTRLHQSYHFLQSFAFDVIFCVTTDNSYNIIRSYVYLEEKKSTITKTGQSFVQILTINYSNHTCVSSFFIPVLICQPLKCIISVLNTFDQFSRVLNYDLEAQFVTCT